MAQHFQHISTRAQVTTFTANLYPESPQSGANTPQLGLCLSGGGSRALSCALGQLSALNAMVNPKTGQTVLQQTPYLSAVSGGSWASVLYTFLPQTINNQPVTDADFLIQPVAPGQLTKGLPSNNSAGNVSYMNPYCMGTVPQQFNPQVIGAFLYTLYEWGFFGNSSRWPWFWIAGVGELILKPFGLYNAFYNPNNNFPEPANFFSLSTAEVANNITPNNPTLTANQFYLTRPGRPSLIVNTNILQNYLSVLSPQVPVQAMPIFTAVPGQSPDGKIIGGGGVESFAFTSKLNSGGVPNKTASVSIARRYSLCDIAGCSSAFFAEYLLQYINAEINTLVAAVKQYLINTLGLSPTLAGIIATALEFVVDAFLDAGSAQLIPQYNYWQLSEVGQSNPPNVTYGFSDGGDFDNSGILGVLAQTNVNRILSFTNTEIPISTDPTTGEILLDSGLALLFGYQDTLVNGKWTSFGGMSPSQPMSYVQVFSDSGGAFAALRQGLYDASCGGTSTLGTAPAAFLQTLTTVDNPVAGIAGNRQVTVLWVYNNRVNQWQNAIVDQNLKNDLTAGQAAQPTGPLMNFPNYFTGLQVYLDVEAVNMLAQLSAWNVNQLQSQILGLLQ